MSDTRSTNAVELAARAALLYAENIIETVREPLLVLDENLYVVSANRAYHETFGVSPQVTNNHLLYQLSGGQWDTVGLRTLLNALINGRADFQDFEIERTFPRIGPKIMRLNARRLHRHEDGPHIGSNRIGMLLLGIEDVTESRRVADALQRSETRYRRLFEAAHDGILLLNAESGAITDANPFLIELLGYPLTELRGKELWQLGLFADREASQAAFRELQAQNYIRYENLPLQTRSGERREVEFISNLYDEGGSSVIQCNIRDITERKRVEKTLEILLAREQHIAHTLQRPLTVGFAEDAFPGLLVATLYAAASAEAQVGGDFFDAFSLSDGRVALAVADTMGKGIFAAARTMQIKDVLRAFARESPPSPADVVAQLNRFACETPRLDEPDEREGNSFTCLALAFLDPATGQGEVVSAGCELPALLRAQRGGGEDDIQYHPTANACLPVGIQPNATYTSVSVQLEPGDTLILTTDGIAEARAPRTKEQPDTAFLGIEGVVALTKQFRDRQRDTLTLKGMGEAILDGARAYAGGVLHDDACVLLVQRQCKEF